MTADDALARAQKCRACRHVIHPDVECGIPTLTHEGTMPCDCDPCPEWCIAQAAEAADREAAGVTPPPQRGALIPTPSAAADPPCDCGVPWLHPDRGER